MCVVTVENSRSFSGEREGETGCLQFMNRSMRTHSESVARNDGHSSLEYFVLYFRVCHFTRAHAKNGICNNRKILLRRLFLHNNIFSCLLPTSQVHN